MPRLPIASIAALLCLAVVALASAASARITVRSIDDLRADPAVAAAEVRFAGLASSEVLYAKCSEAYGITQEQRDYNTKRYAEVTKEYTDAYYTTYVKMVGAPPPQKVIDYYLQHIANLQQSVVATTDSLITQSCAKGALQKLATATEKARQVELEAAATAKGGKKRHDPWSR